MDIAYRTVAIGDVDVFCREAGPDNAPVILLLHGFPTSSHMFRNLIPMLADRFRLIAPDLPGFGHTKTPSGYTHSFDGIARIIEGFTAALGLKRYALYVFDYGVPTGFRLAMWHPKRVTAIVSQNGNAYIEGLSAAWEPWQTYWREPTAANREACRIALDPATIRDVQYLHGADATRVSPDGYTLDSFFVGRPGLADVQLDLILDYRSNVALYPDFQRSLREHKPPVLAVWGRNDPFFLPAGAEAFRRDVPDAEVHLLDTGHFALETHSDEIARLMRDFLGRKLAG